MTNMTILKETEAKVIVVLGVKLEDGKIETAPISGYLPNKDIELVIPEGVEIVNTPSHEYSKITKVTLPSTLKEIGEHAFSYTKLTKIEFPDKLEVIGSNAFCGCGLTKVDFPLNLKTIESGAFKDNKLTEVKVNKGLLNLGDAAFANNPLEKIDLEGKLLKIGRSAFKAKKGTTTDLEITLPVNLVELGINAFKGNTIKQLKVSEQTIGIIDSKGLNKAFGRGVENVTITTYPTYKVDARAFTVRGRRIELDVKLENNTLSIFNGNNEEWSSWDLGNTEEIADLEKTNLIKFDKYEDTYEEWHPTLRQAEASLRHQNTFNFEGDKIIGWLEHIDLINTVDGKVIESNTTNLRIENMKKLIASIKEFK